jgi:hypothetical protein
MAESNCCSPSFCSLDRYEGDDFLNMEERVLNTLQFNFYLPTGASLCLPVSHTSSAVVDFLGVFLTVIPEIVNSSPSQISLCMVGPS